MHCHDTVKYTDCAFQNKFMYTVVYFTKPKYTDDLKLEKKIITTNLGLKFVLHKNTFRILLFLIWTGLEMATLVIFHFEN